MIKIVGDYLYLIRLIIAALLDSEERGAAETATDGFVSFVIASQTAYEAAAAAAK